MTIALESPFGAPLAGPLDSQTSHPFEAVIGVREHGSPDVWVSAHVRDREAEESRRRAREPREREVQQYLDDERDSRIAQARALAASMPESPVAWSRLAQVLVTSGDVEEAVAVARETLRLRLTADVAPSPAALSAFFVAARVLAASGAADEAEEVLGGLPAPGPWTLLHAAIAEDRGDSRAALARLIEDDSGEGLAFRGFLRLQLREPQRALADLRAAQRRGAGGPSLLLNLAFAYACVGSPQKAIRAAQQAVSIAPQSRHASFNLASYLRSSGRNDDAVSELLRLRTLIGDGDPQVASALADAYMAAGKPRNAVRELRRAQHHHDLPPTSRRLSELKANTALLEWKAGEKSKSAVLKVVREQLDRVGAHFPLVLMLADLTPGRQVLRELRQLYTQMEASDPAADLRLLLVRLQLADGELAEATTTALAYADDHPLDVEAVRGALILQGQVRGEYAEAAQRGLAALTRIPGDPMLRNNVAFCLALAGRSVQALDVLRSQPLDDPYFLATRGLVAFGLGNLEEGLEWYERAHLLAQEQIASEEDEQDFLLLLRTQEFLALQQFAPTAEVTRKLGASLPPPLEWPEEASYLVLREVAQRLEVPRSGPTGTAVG